MIRDLLHAIALMIVLEGLLPFLAPSRFRQSLARLVQVDDQRLRVFGLMCMIGGLVALQAIRWLL